MKKVIIVHGWGDSANTNWTPWLKAELEKDGAEVLAISIPDSEHPNQDKWVDFLSNVASDPDENLVLVGHSLGGITILRYIERLPENIKIGGIVLVSSFSDPIGWPEPDSFCQTPVNFEKVKKIIGRKSIMIHSDNDKYVSNAVAENLHQNLGGELVVIHNGGHLTSKYGFEQLPEVLTSVKKLFI